MLGERSSDGEQSQSSATTRALITWQRSRADGTRAPAMADNATQIFSGRVHRICRMIDSQSL